jgi:hypothetical protein
MTERQQRRLAAILAADIAGYSVLIGADEEDVLAGRWDETTLRDDRFPAGLDICFIASGSTDIVWTVVRRS